MNRRKFIQTTSATVTSSVLTGIHTTFARTPPDFKIGITDWNLGTSCDPSLIPLAASVGLAGIQVSVGRNPDSIPLRDVDVRRQYQSLGRQHGITFHSVAAGGILNSIPLKSEPQSAVYVIDAIEAAAALGAGNVLVAFFGNADLRAKDDSGDVLNISEGPFRSYRLEEKGVTRVVEALRQIVPRAEDTGVILGLENTLTAEQNLEIIDRIGSDMVQVYYDVGNSTGYGYDVPGEIRMLGNDRICEIHLKETLGLNDPGRPLLGGPSEGGVDFAAAAAACRVIGFDKWYVLETSGRQNHFEEDTRANIAFAKQHFG